MKFVLLFSLLVSSLCIFNYKDSLEEGDMYLSTDSLPIFLSADHTTNWGEITIDMYHEEEVDEATAYYTNWADYHETMRE